MKYRVRTKFRIRDDKDASSYGSYSELSGIDGNYDEEVMTENLVFKGQGNDRCVEREFLRSNSGKKSKRESRMVEIEEVSFDRFSKTKKLGISLDPNRFHNYGGHRTNNI